MSDYEMDGEDVELEDDDELADDDELDGPIEPLDDE
jgi:hypothetical protein